MRNTKKSTAVVARRSKPVKSGPNFSSDLAREERTDPRTRNPSAERLSDGAYRAILQGLFDRRIPVGAFVSQMELIRLLGFPMQPLRDALRVLETEGVVSVHPRAGIQFLRADSELARTTYEFRAMIERPGVRRFAAGRESALIDRLSAEHSELIARIESDGVTTANREALMRLDDRLHASFIAPLKNPLVETTARRLDNYVAIIHLERKITVPLAMQTLREHLAILAACANRNPKNAEAALETHLESALARVLAMI